MNVIDKIKKLLRMKRGGTPEEVATALRIAQELAGKHGVDLSQVNPDEDTPKGEQIGHQVPLSGSRIQHECRFAGLVCEQFFNVIVFTNCKGHRTGQWGYRLAKVYELVFVGTEWEREVAIYVFRFLVRHFRSAWTTRRGRCRNRQAFMWGMYVGLCSKLRERQPAIDEADKTALVATHLAVAKQDYIARHFGQLTSHDVKPDSDATLAKWRGYLAGRETEIRPAVEGKPQEGRLMLA